MSHDAMVIVKLRLPLGISVEGSKETGMVVTRVKPGGSAAKTGIVKVGMTLLVLDGKSLEAQGENFVSEHCRKAKGHVVCTFASSAHSNGDGQVEEAFAHLRHRARPGSSRTRTQPPAPKSKRAAAESASAQNTHSADTRHNGAQVEQSWRFVYPRPRTLLSCFHFSGCMRASMRACTCASTCVWSCAVPRMVRHGGVGARRQCISLASAATLPATGAPHWLPHSLQRVCPIGCAVRT